MTVIGTTATFAETRDEIITDALVNLGVVAPGKSVTDARTAGLLTHAARALGRMVKAMDADGQFLWRIVRFSASLDGGNSSLALGSTVLDIDGPIGIWLANDGSDRSIVEPMSRDEYMALRRNDSTPVEVGRPSRYYFERQQPSDVNGAATLYFDRVSDIDSYTFEYAAFVRGADFVTGATGANFPTKWISCLVYGLTAELAPAYRQPGLLTSYRQMFAEEKARLLADDTERGNLVLVPFGNGSY